MPPASVSISISAYLTYCCECISENKGADEVGARGWGEGETGGLKGFNKSSLQKQGVRFAGDDEEDDESGEFESYCSDEEREGAPARGEGLDDLFDKTLEEYGSDDMGDLEDEVRAAAALSYTMVYMAVI